MQLMLTGSPIVSGGDYNNYVQMSNGGGYGAYTSALPPVHSITFKFKQSFIDLLSTEPMSGYMRLYLSPNSTFQQTYSSILFSILRSLGKTYFYYFMSGQRVELTDASHEYIFRIDTDGMVLRAYTDGIESYSVSMNANDSSVGFMYPRYAYAYNVPNAVFASNGFEQIFDYIRYEPSDFA